MITRQTYKMKRGTKIIVAITLMTVFDFIATAVGLIGGFAVEINVLAAKMFEWSLASGLIVIGLVTATLIFILACNINKYKWLQFASMFIVGFKAAITYFHLHWIFNSIL